MQTWTFAKGHGTANDFVLLLDRTGKLDLPASTVRYLCDRRTGLGGDGLIRVVPARHVDGWDGDRAAWFMDYRNADGSVAEMCGNGLRVFVRYLLDRGLADGPELIVGTRAGHRRVSIRPDGLIRTEIGPVRLTGTASVEYDGPEAAVRATGAAAEVGNPHLVVELPDHDALAAVRLDAAPRVDAGQFPDGVNVEFVARREAVASLELRVYERGVGETRSCGTGTVAAVAAVEDAADPAIGTAIGTAGTSRWDVRVQGGDLVVELEPPVDGARTAWLTGPAVIVAHGEVAVP